MTILTDKSFALEFSQKMAPFSKIILFYSLNIFKYLPIFLNVS